MKTYIVVGGGILGASTAYHLAKDGYDVTLVDREDKGQATYAGAGIICPWLSQRRNQVWYRLVKAGANYYPTLINALKNLGETNTGYKQIGAMALHHDEKKLNDIEIRAYKRRENAPEIGEITRFSHSEAKRMFPPLADGYGAVHVSGGARVDGKDLRDALLRAAKKHGANVIHGDAKLMTNRTNVTGVEVDGNELLASKVVLAAGAWTDELLHPLGKALLVKPQKGQILHLELPQTNNDNWPVIIPPGDYYMVSFGNGRLVTGATREDNSGFDYRVTAGGIYDVLNETFQVAPGLKESRVVETRVGFRPFTPGSLPVIGKVPDIEGVVMATGLGATGLTAGPFLGSLLAKLAVGEKSDFPIEDYNCEAAFQS
ncbi:FAD-binding oxidoreductase [Salipaludibacillus agaradhaerens]|uniref:FAD-binding oxidoreductase n=1 Tax=Salipaludibacillus agaradhaerens TaxID=76935 RepID=A0A9Q4B0Y0_SALAG|nr:FAD-binding oxidoreductase [Salipaludibacillus agaradhaerens]MCR6096299.1 FAD-binding oxidoreductase [Salipaludibacillus agaradhaerens]MCR6114142.1 FAD-binding oxidoreductase [Salipaludibacillus agaradhaerens]